MESEVLPKNGLLPICLTEDNLLPLEIQILKLQLYLVVYHKAQFLVHFFFLIYINDFSSCSDILDLHLFADDSNLFFTHKNLSQLELIVNNELSYVHTWLCANKLSLNIVKSSCVLFHPPQRKIEASINLYINDTSLNEKDNIKYLGIIIDSNLNWKKQVKSISTKMKRNIGILSKLRVIMYISIFS